MRTAPLLFDAWQNNGIFVGDLKPVTRITVQFPWPDIDEDLSIRTTVRPHDHTAPTPGVGNSTSRGLPFRWYQQVGRPEIVEELPCLSMVTIDETIDQDAAVMNITMFNQQHYMNNAIPSDATELGQPGYFCVDDATELLSQRGWLSWNEVTVGDHIWTLNRASGLGEWEEVLDIEASHFAGELVGVANRHLSAAVTPGHRWPVTNAYRRRTRGGYDLRITEDLNKWDEIPLRADPADVPETISDDLVELLGWVITEGTFQKQGGRQGGRRVSIYQSATAKPDNCKRIHSLLERLDLRFTSRQRDDGMVHFRFSGPVAHAVRSMIPDKMLTVDLAALLSVRQRRLLRDVMLMGDGSVEANGKRTFYTSTESDADLFQMLCVLAGDGARVSSRMLHTEINGYAYDAVVWQVTVLSNAHVSAGRLTRSAVAYDGIVWCPRTTNETFLARRDGAVFYTGNTPNRGDSPEARARWRHEVNEWHGRLEPNTILRVFTGYGGATGTIADAVDAGNLVPYGVYMIDHRFVSTDGSLKIKARNMAKLTIDQPLYIPLVPKSKYPLHYYRWSTQEKLVVAAAKAVTIATGTPDTTGVTNGEKHCVYVDSSQDRWEGPNASIYGHRGTDTTDDDPTTYALSVGNNGADREFSCFAGETSVLTWEHGRVPIASLAGRDATVLTQSLEASGGPQRWQRAPFRQFGERQLWEVTLTRHGRTKTIRATEDHDWVIRQSKNLEKRRTDQLAVGDKLHVIRPPSRAGRGCTPSPIGVMAGLVYGDGSVLRRSSQIQLFGGSRVFADLFRSVATVVTRWQDSKVSDGPLNRIVGVPQYVDHVTGLPRHFKSPPPLDQGVDTEDTGYLFGWLAGYFAADGCVNTDITLTSVDRAALEHAQRVADRVGIATYDIGPNGTSGGRWALRFVPHSIPDGFFLLPKHQDRWADRKKQLRKRDTPWVVAECRETDAVEPVYCATVEGTATFVVDEWILSGNCVWWEYSCGQNMNAVYVNPLWGGYTMYVSVKEGGVWKGTDTIPYDPSHILATQADGVDTGADIKYIAKFTVPWEQAREYVLPRVYNADRVRITFRHLVDSNLGVWQWRAGVRGFRILGRKSAAGSLGPSSTEDTTTIVYSPFIMAADARRDPAKPFSQGYLTVSCYFQDDAFGDDRRLPQSAGSPGGEIGCTAVRHNKTNDGYYMLDAGGNIDCYGAAVHYGDPATTDGFTSGAAYCWDMAITPSGLGYWVLTTLGHVYAYGDAVAFADVATSGSLCSSIESHPTDQGYWVVRNDGTVHVRGAASFFGNFGVLRKATDADDASENAQCIRRTSTGQGYWILTSLGQVKACGDATFFGQPAKLANLKDLANPVEVFRRAYWELLPSPVDKGYLLVHASGQITPFGEIEDFGDAIPGQRRTLRYDGNYQDYTDIIKDLLLWSGFLLYDPDWPANQPAPVYAGLETTGSFAKEPLPDDIFDKQPVINAITKLKETVGYIWFVDHEGRARFECVDTATQILTKRGWLGHDEVRAGDFAFSLNTETGKSEWSVVSEVNHYDVEDEALVSIEGRSHSSLTTRNHRWWVVPPSRKGRKPGRSKWLRSDELNSESCVPISAPRGDAPLAPTYCDDFVELMAWWLTEGHLTECGGGTISQSRGANQEYVDRIHGCLQRLYGDPGPSMGGPFIPYATRQEAIARVRVGEQVKVVARDIGHDRHTVGRWVRRGPGTVDAMWNFSERSDPTPNSKEGVLHQTIFGLSKRLVADLLVVAPIDKTPSMDFLCSLTEGQARLFVETCVAGDGNQYTVRGYGPYSDFTQSHPGRTAAFEIACVLAGRAPRTTARAAVGDRQPNSRTKILTIDKVQPIAAERNKKGATTVTEVPYTGVVWCPTVENQTWLARRNGTVFFTGNSPNFWRVGNFNEDGLHVDFVPVIDERTTLVEYAVDTSDEPLRSDITISSYDPTADLKGTVTTKYTPDSAKGLKGLVKPALWINDFFTDKDEQQLMAELIALHIAFQERIGQATIIANPALETNDQVRIYERQTGEVYIHYIRGINFAHNLMTGEYTMQLTTHWLAAGSDSGDVVGGEAFPVSPLLQSRIDAGQFGKTSRDPVPTVWPT